MIKAKLTEQQRMERFTVPCKGCEKRVSTSLKKPYCSHECRRKHKPSKASQIDCACAACGERIVKKVYERSGVYCCDQKCQNVWAGMCGGDRLARSKKAKDKWKKKASMKRRAASISAKWWSKCRREISRETQTNEWNKRCENAQRGLTSRLVYTWTKKHRKPYDTFDLLCEVGLKDNHYQGMSQWGKKCYSTCKNMKWRRRLRNARRISLTPIAEREVQLRQLTLWDVLQTQPENN